MTRAGAAWAVGAAEGPGGVTHGGEGRPEGVWVAAGVASTSGGMRRRRWAGVMPLGTGGKGRMAVAAGRALPDLLQGPVVSHAVASPSLAIAGSHLVWTCGTVTSVTSVPGSSGGTLVTLVTGAPVSTYRRQASAKSARK